MEIMRYAEMFQGIRKQTMVEAQDTVARIVTQTDIFDELRHRRAMLEARKASLRTQRDELLAAEDTQFGGNKEMLAMRSQIDKLTDELAALRAQRDKSEAKLRTSGDVKIMASITVIDHLRQGGYVFTCICLFVCLSV